MDAVTVGAQRTPVAWPPGRIYLVASAIFLLALGGAGFLVNGAFPLRPGEVDAAGSGHTFGIFETNGWHNLAGLGSGLLALGLALRPEWARFGALLKGWIYVAVTVAIMIWGGETFLFASNTADQFIHAALAIGGLATGLMTPRPAPRGAADHAGPG